MKISEYTEKTSLGDDDLILIVDDDDSLNKKVKGSNVKASIFGWTKYTVTRADLQAVGADTIELGTDIVPAGGILTGAKMKHSAAWTGGGITKVICELIDENNVQYIGDGVNRLNVFTAPGVNNGAQMTGINDSVSGASIPNHSAASKLRLRFTFTGGVRGDLTTGSVDVWIKLETVV